MALALNNLKKVDMPLNKETKPSNILVLASLPCIYHMTEAVQAVWKVPAVVSCIIVIGIPTHFALPLSSCDFESRTAERVIWFNSGTLCFTNSNRAITP